MYLNEKWRTKSKMRFSAYLFIVSTILSLLLFESFGVGSENYMSGTKISLGYPVWINIDFGNGKGSLRFKYYFTL